MTLNKENLSSQMRKGFLEYSILLLIHHKPYYTSEIIKELKEANLIVVEGTLYPLLTRLKKKGHLDYKWEESTQGPPRKYYQITAEGKEFLSALDTAYNELINTINTIKNTSNEK